MRVLQHVCEAREQLPLYMLRHLTSLTIMLSLLNE